MQNVINPNIFPPQASPLLEAKKETNVVQNPAKKAGLLDKFETSIRNSADVNDTIKVPRTIFKGYLSIMTGTTLITLAMLAKNKYKNLSNSLSILSAGLMLFGTYSFVRPYLLKTPKDSK